MKRDLELPLGFDRHMLGMMRIEFWFDSQSILWISNWKWCLIGMPGMPSAWNVPFSIRFDVGSSHGVDDVDSSCVASRAQWCFLYSAPTQSVIYNLHIWVYLVYFSLSLSLSVDYVFRRQSFWLLFSKSQSSSSKKPATLIQATWKFQLPTPVDANVAGKFEWYWGCSSHPQGLESLYWLYKPLVSGWRVYLDYMDMHK